MTRPPAKPSPNQLAPSPTPRLRPRPEPAPSPGPAGPKPSAGRASPASLLKYAPRPWQKKVLDKLAAHRFAVVVAHRRAGKTEVMVLRLLLAAIFLSRTHPAPLFGYIAPFLNQARAVAWGRLKYYCRALPEIRVNETETSVTLWNGAAIRLFGADYPDRLRGLGFDGVVLDEVAQMKPDTWGAVVR
ncbi:MAG: hypothetical protein LBC90_09005, partial [Candidatus Adiutrix sp.]|nr:hypothetical protein [Candidatus Adiutrix sp.]